MRDKYEIRYEMFFIIFIVQNNICGFQYFTFYFLIRKIMCSYLPDCCPTLKKKITIHSGYESLLCFNNQWKRFKEKLFMSENVNSVFTHMDTLSMECIIYNIDHFSVFSGFYWKMWHQGSCTSDWSGYLCCPHLRSWTRYRTETIKQSI